MNEKIRRVMNKLKMILLTEEATETEKAQCYAVWMAWIEGLYINKVIDDAGYTGLYREVNSFRNGMDFLAAKSGIA